VRDWLAAIDEERRAHGSFAALETELDTMEEVRAYRAWRKALDLALTEGPEDSAETARSREALKRQVAALVRTVAQERQEI